MKDETIQDASLHDEQMRTVNDEIAKTNEHLATIQQEAIVLDEQLAELSAQSEQYALLRRALDSVSELDQAGLGDIFWGDTFPAIDRTAQMQSVAHHISDYARKIDTLQQQRSELAERMGEHYAVLDDLAIDLYEIEQQRESKLNEWVIEREETPLPKFMQAMPWMRGFEEDRRFRQSLLASFAVSALIGLIVPFVDLPIPDLNQTIDVPERFAQLVQKPKSIPPPIQPVRPDPIEEAVPDKKVEPPKEKPPEIKPEMVAEQPAPAVAPKESTREKVASKGILAFRDSFANLADSKPSTKLGAEARINSAGANASRRPERNMITTKASGSSGGINLAAVSRDLGEGGGGAMAGVQTTQVASSIPGAGTADRPLSAGAVAGRTDEEIQIVFDRYKAALYRLYNRELRSDPTLQGQIVLQLTIEPDGSVSFIDMQSSDMNAPDLAVQVVNRVRAFDFGAKTVPAITIIYPIDFLPTA